MLPPDIFLLFSRRIALYLSFSVLEIGLVIFVFTQAGASTWSVVLYRGHFKKFKISDEFWIASSPALACTSHKTIDPESIAHKKRNASLTSNQTISAALLQYTLLLVSGDDEASDRISNTGRHFHR